MSAEPVEGSTRSSSLARAAVEVLDAELTRTGQLAPGHSLDLIHRPEGGKMLGVLVVKSPDGAVGFLRAFSGQWGEAWEVPGWVPPLFDIARRHEVQGAVERKVASLTSELLRIESSSAWENARDALQAFDQETRRLTSGGHRNARRIRIRARREERAPLYQEAHRYERKMAAVRRLRACHSRRLMWTIPALYRLRNRLGEETTVEALFRPGYAPWGAGDCAAPRLLSYAWTHGLQPLGMAERWWGRSPPGGGRVHGDYAAPCTSKCGPLMPFLTK